jgi:hypothetical protein
MDMKQTSKLALDFVAMINEGMEPSDCLRYATDEGIEYPDAVWLVSRILKLDDDAVEYMEDRY